MNDSLAKYGTSHQSKILASLFTDLQFLEQISDILEPEYFDSDANKWIIDWTKNYFDSYKTLPTIQALKGDVDSVKTDVLRTSLMKSAIELYNQFDAQDLQWVKDKTLDFCKNQKIKNAILHSADLVKNGQYEEIEKLIKEALEAGQPADLGHDYFNDVEARYTEEARSPIPTGWAVIDDITKGGISPGELAVIVAPPGVGKSWCLANIGAQAVKEGKRVLHYTLELNDFYTAQRYDAILTGIPSQKLEHHVDTIKERIESIKSEKGGDLKIKKFYTKKLSIAGLRAHIQRNITVNKLKPDLVIIDYADLMKVPKGFKDKYEALEALYEELRGLAGELGIAIWTASQSGRASVNEDIVESDSVAGSFAKIMVADFIMSYSRKVEDKLRGTGRIHIIKNRFGPDGMTFPSKNDLSNGQIYLYEATSEKGAMTAMEMKDDRAMKEKLRQFQIIAGKVP